MQSHIWLTNSSYMITFLCIFSYIRKPLLMYDFAPDPIWISLRMRKILFTFLSVYWPVKSGKPTGPVEPGLETACTLSLHSHRIIWARTTGKFFAIFSPRCFCSDLMKRETCLEDREGQKMKRNIFRLLLRLLCNTIYIDWYFLIIYHC